MFPENSSENTPLSMPQINWLETLTQPLEKMSNDQSNI